MRFARPAHAPAVTCSKLFANKVRCKATIVFAARLVDAELFEKYALQLQGDILREAEALEKLHCQDGQPRTFVIDRWERDAANPRAGYGITAVLEDGVILEKAAANISVVRGTLTPQRAQAMSSRGRASICPDGGQQYSAIAMSLVFHSAHPFIPTLRADVRLFEVEGNAWFGGGCDLTPSYLTHVSSDGSTTDLREDCREFHAFWKALCDRHGPHLYASYKKWCDEYFYIPCRQEHRGVGGLFFDDLESCETTVDAEAFTRDVGNGILASWLPLVKRRAALPFSAAHRTWQQLRRGRYLEFNLLYDRGVKFGLDGGRIESIMVSAPPTVQWKYKHSTEPGHGTPEEEMLTVLRQPVAWTE